MCVKYRHLFINIKVWKYSLYSREKIWVGEFPNCLVGRQSAFWAMVGSSSLLQGNKNLVHHILSPSLSFPLWLFYPSSLSTIASCFFLAPPLHIMTECERGLSAGREERRPWCGDIAWEPFIFKGSRNQEREIRKETQTKEQRCLGCWAN